MHFSLFFFLTVFSSPLKKTRVPGTAGNSAQTTRGRRNEWHKRGASFSGGRLKREREKESTSHISFAFLSYWAVCVKNTRKRDENRH